MTVEVALSILLKEGYSIKIGTGKNTAYILNENLKESETSPSHKNSQKKRL
ncbi:hypothetical protein [Acetobacterium woodii]|uniref:hypothetical protein n=1 Tax=Acetobacterium woodii TaxID=33952 RepID=UPI000310D216|nr:hypothetical protein [Acetobacterium woodii]